MSAINTDSLSPRSEPSSPPFTRALIGEELRRLHLTPSRGWGQSFLLDEFVADAEAALVPGGPGEVVEIGGGLGTLTQALLRRGVSPLVVIERDARLAAYLRSKFGEAIRVVKGDALKVDLGTPRAVVGNLPYSMAKPIFLRLWERAIPTVVALIQREVAERMAAGPGSRIYGRLSIVTALYGSVELFQVVPSQSFFPKPAVDGRIVRFVRRSDALPVPSLAILGSVLQSLFSGRRKQLKNLLPRIVPDPRELGQVLRDAGWPIDWPGRRPEDLDPDAYFRLVQALAKQAAAGEA